MRAASVARAGGLVALCLAVTACSRGEPELMHTQRGMRTPDEFAILPSKPLETPPNYSSLPAPTSGVPNRTDVDPRAEAVAALGGNPAAVATDGKFGNDGALIQQTTRYGVDPNIRVELAEADLEFRKRNRGRLLERWLAVPTYYTAYEREEMDQHSVLWLYRRQGYPTPAAPPDPEAN